MPTIFTMPSDRLIKHCIGRQPLVAEPVSTGVRDYRVYQAGQRQLKYKLEGLSRPDCGPEQYLSLRSVAQSSRIFDTIDARDAYIYPLLTIYLTRKISIYREGNLGVEGVFFRVSGWNQALVHEARDGS